MSLSADQLAHNSNQGPGSSAKKRKNRNEQNGQQQQWQRLTGAPTWELPAITNGSDKKFTGKIIV